MINSRPLNILIMLLSFLLLFNGCGKKHKDAAAVVNGKVINNSALAQEMTRIKQRFYDKSDLTDQQFSQMEHEVLDILIGGELLYQASQAEVISVNDQEIDDELEKAKKLFPDTANFKNSFTRDDIRKKIAIEKFITLKFADTTTVTEEQGEKYYEEHLDDFTRQEQLSASHILIKLPEDASQEAADKTLVRIKEIKKELATGTDFADLAKKYSEDSTADKGGYIGIFMRGQMPKPFEESAFSTAPGETAIARTKAGYHLIKVLDKKEKVVISFEEVKEKLLRFLKQQKVQEKLENFITKQRQNARIEILLEKPS